MAKDECMVELINNIRNGWPGTKSEVAESQRPYYDYRDELSIENGIILKGEAILVPKSLRAEMKERAHISHLGYDSMMRRLKGTLFWPGMAKEIKQLCDACEPCQDLQPRNGPETLKLHGNGNVPWEKVGMDLFEIKGVVVDYFTNFIECDLLTTITSTQVIMKLKKPFARFGIPKSIVSDVGTQFTSFEFEQFVKQWGIVHLISSPGHQQSNRKAEAAVKTMKHMMIKTLKDDRDQNEALLELRNTPCQSTGLSSAEMMFGHCTRSNIPSVKAPQRQVNPFPRYHRKQVVKRCYDRKTRDLPKLSIGQSIYFKHKEGDRSYIVQNEDGVECWRNRVRIRPTKVQVRIRDKSPQSTIWEPFQPCRGPVCPPTVDIDQKENLSTEMMTWRFQVKMLEVKLLQKRR